MDVFSAQDPAKEFILNNSFLRCLPFIGFTVVRTVLQEVRYSPQLVLLFVGG